MPSVKMVVSDELSAMVEEMRVVWGLDNKAQAVERCVRYAHADLGHEVLRPGDAEKIRQHTRDLIAERREEPNAKG